MDGARDFLDAVERHAEWKRHLLGLFHILIGRRISKNDGTVVSSGLSWRELASELKRRRWEPDVVRELGLDPATFAPRDRQRFWYSVISQAQVSSPAAIQAADRFAVIAQQLGFIVGAAPRA